MKPGFLLRIASAFFFVWILIGTMPKASAEVPVEAFARMPKYDAISISPDGKYMAAKYEESGAYYFMIFDISLNTLNSMHGLNIGKFDVQWTEWASNTRVLVSLGFASRRGGTPIYETRLLAMNFDGSKTTNMVKQKRNEIAVQFQDNIIDFLPDDPEHVLMSYNDDDPRRPRVYRTDIFTGKGRVIEGGRKDVIEWITDVKGNVRAALGQKDGAWQYIIKKPGSKKWVVLRRWEALSSQSFYIRGFSPNPNMIYVESNHEGGTNGLYEYDLTTDQFVRLISSRPEVDVDDIWFDQKTGIPKRVSYLLDGTQYHWLDPKLKTTFNSIEKLLPGKTVNVIETSPNENIWIIYAGAVTDPGGFYIYKKQSGTITYLGANFPELEGVTLSKMIAFDYQARDGLEIPAYVSLPPGYSKMEQAKLLPLVVMPHGGPTSRDYLSFNPFVQHVTSQGYVVLQMNFRGSAGYGAEFEAAGYHEWGGKMQDDVTDGVQTLVGMGVADPNRICIAGISYGGYAALMGAVKTPGLYKCAIGTNGVYDLRDLISSAFNYIGGRSQLRTAHIGQYSEKEFLAKASPRKRASEIKIPILLIASDDDRTVRPKQSKDMASALKRNKVDYEFIELENGGHSMRTTESRLTYMEAVDKFLAKHLN